MSLEVVEPTFIILQLSSAFPPLGSPPRKCAGTKVGLMKIQKVNGGRRDVLNARVYSGKEEREREREREREGSAGLINRRWSGF